MKEELKVVANEPIDLESETASDAKNESNVEEGSKDTKDVIEEPVQDTEEPAPPAPPRPTSPTTTLKNTLKEAFPSSDDRLITAILIASQGNLDTAFNAMLYLNDETMEPPPIVAVNPVEPISKETDDEKLARQLQKEFEMEERRRKRRVQQKQRHQQEEESSDEFEQIKKNFSEGLEEARNTLNGWVSGLARKFDGQPKNDNQLFGALGGSSFKKNNNKFDEDPKIINNFDKIKLDDNEGAPELPKRNAPSMANSDAFLVDSDEERI